MRSLFFLIFLFAAGLILSFGNTGCANIVPPVGGPRDTIAPVLVEATPGDSTTNFGGRRITFTFDEFIEFDQAATVMFSPTLPNSPDISVRLRTLTVRFNGGDTALSPNTTYTLDFGKAIVDVNERNPVQNFVYRFSTGPVLDSLEFSGNVVLAETGGIDSNLVIGLYRNLTDSAVTRQAAQYYSRVDARGNFRFTSLPADTFAVYAFGGDAATQGRFRRYSTTQLFGFLDEPVIIRDSTPRATIYAYRASATPPGTAPAATAGGRDNRLRFTTNVTGEQLDLLDDLVLTFATPLSTLDSARIQLSTDSVFTPASFNLFLDTTQKILRIRSPWLEGRPYNLVLDREFASDTAGRRLLKTDTLNFVTRQANDYGRLVIRFRNVDLARHPVLLFVENEKVVESIPLTGGPIERALFPPGEYNLRILYDENRNGKWDPGSFFGDRKQPERVVPVERKITVKPAWDNDFDISL